MSCSILFVCQSFPPHGSTASRRPLGFAKNLVKLGYGVTILTQHVGETHCNYDGSFIYDENSFNLITVKLDSKLALHNKVYNKVINLARPINRPREFTIAARKFIENATFPKFDIIFATFPDHASLRIAADLSSKLGIPWIADFRDCYQNNGTLIQNLLRPYRMYALRKIVRSAWCATYVAPSLEKNVKHITRKKTFKLENAFDEDDLVYYSYKKNSRLTFTYTGNLHLGKQSLIPLLDAIDFLDDKGRKNLQDIRILVFGAVDAKTCKEHKKHKLGHLIEFRGRVRRDVALRHQSEADVLVMGRAIGSKLYEYMFARKPILMMHSDNGYMEQLFEKTRIGWAPKNQIELNKIVQTIVTAWAESEKLNCNQNLNLDRYKYSQRVHELIRIIEECK